MNKSKAIGIARNWLEQNPKTLESDEVFEVLDKLEFIFKKKIKHTTYLYEHPCLAGNPYFQFNTLKISLHHGKNDKNVILIGSVKVIIRALKLHPELKND